MCGQGIGDYTPETLYLNGDSCTALRRGSDGMLYVPSSFMKKANKHLGDDFTSDISIENWAQSDGTWDTISYWLDEAGNRINVYNPAMKNSPVKVVRSHNHIYIYVFYHLSGKYNKITELWRAQEPWQPIEQAFCKWANNGNLYPNNHTSEQFGNYAGVQVHVNCAFTLKEPSLTVEINYGDGGSHNTVDSDDWRINNVGDIVIYLNHTSSLKNFINIAAHEFGHVLGINDAYQKGVASNPTATSEVPDKDIMRSITYATFYDPIVTPNDIEMAWEAWKKNSMQNFVGVWLLQEKSEVVRE